MLKLPAWRHYPDATVYQDDAEFWRFYVIPGFPRVRLTSSAPDAEPDPVFLLIKYALSDDARAADPKLPKGGGYLTFDAELALDDTRLAEVTAELQQDVDAWWERKKQAPDSRLKRLSMEADFTDAQIGGHWANRGMSGSAMASPVTGLGATLTIPAGNAGPPPADAPAPRVLLGEPIWKSGTVTLKAPQSPALVVSANDKTKASLLGSNVAAFALDLTADGASFMEQTLLGPDGAGATDLTPLQVVYELKLLAKLPPARVHIKFTTREVYHSLHELYHEHDNCSDDYYTSETMLTSAISAGLVSVKIDAGGVTDETIVQSLTQQAKATVQKLLEERFAKKERAPATEWGDEVADDSAEVYRLKQEAEIDMTDFESTMTLATTTELEIAPQGTLATFFRGRSGADMKRFVRVVDLDDPFFHTLDLTVRPFARWADDDIAFIEVEVTHGRGADAKTQSFTFTPADTAAKRWDPGLVEDHRVYKWRWRYAFNGRAPSDWIDEGDSTARELNVSLASPGFLDVEVTGVGLDYENILDAAVVHLRYADPAQDIPMESRSILLSKERQSGRWQRRLYGPWRQPVEHRTEYLLQTGTVIDSGWKRTDGPNQQLPILRPPVDQLDVTLLPAGPGWDTAIQSVVSLRYEDGTYHKDAQFAFKANTEFKVWSVLLLSAAQRRFEYKVVSTFKNGDVQETAWLARDSDQAVPVVVQGPPRVKVAISGLLVDFVSTPVVEVTVSYHDPMAAGPVTRTYSVQKESMQHDFSTERRPDGPQEYRYQIVYYPLDGAPVTREWQTEATGAITIPRYTVPRVGAEFNAVLIDFTKTPVVEVDLAYDDPQSGQRHRHTLTFTEKGKQAWFVPVLDTAERSYAVEITWYLPDGEAKKSARITTEKTAMTLPPYKPAEA